jgi:SAM-dependent methyltransferase
VKKWRVAEEPDESGYVFTNDGAQVGDRWSALSELFDEATFRHLDRLGVGPGWHCLDVGAGGGRVAQWLADRVVPEGSVTASDIDTRWLDALDDPRLRVLRHDATRDPLPAAYDLVHTRLVLVHLPDVEAVLDRLVGALRPGGWVLLEEFDVSFVGGVCHDPQTDAERLANLVDSQFVALVRARGARPDLAHNLWRLLVQRGLVQARAEGTFVIGGSAASRLLLSNYQQVQDHLLESGGVSVEDFRAHLADLRAGTLPVSLPAMVRTWARRPP